jgi:serine/threonine protein kinase/tetratricopeptide (TPR) repeat protein
MAAERPDIEAIFFEALQQEPQSRAAYLNEVCGQDVALRQRVEQFLDAQADIGSFLQAPAAAPLVATVDEQPIRERPGTVIGPYKLLEQIGEGGFGVVFMADQQQPVRRKVALKVLKPGMDSRQVVARFEAERQALALMDHPNIARVFDGGTTPFGRPFFVMELVKGVPITDFCDQKQLTPRQRLALLVSVCHAVQHAHQKGIIHRDLKPSNVLVSVHDTTPVVKVIDFGVAKALGQELTDKTLFTGFAQLIGTPLYMSPEQAGESSLDVDTRSDIYALGVLLYELLTGMTPFDKERLRTAGYDEIRRIIREEEPPRPSTRVSTLGQAAETVSANRRSDPKRLRRLLHGELDWVVMKALEKDRNRRYESASAFAADVERYLNDEPVLACPPSAAYRFRKFARRNKRTLVTTSFLAVVLVTAVGAVAGAFGWAIRDRGARQARMNQGIELALSEAGTARARALTVTDNPYQWEAALGAALSALKRAEGLAAEDEAALEPVLREQLLTLRASLDADEIDRRFAARFDDIRLEQSDLDPKRSRYREEIAFAALRDAFRTYYGVDVGVTPVAQVTALTQQRPKPIQEYLVAAFEECLAQAPKPALEVRQWLAEVVDAADPDSWRRQARAALAARRWQDLEVMTRDPGTASQPPSFLRRLAMAIPPEQSTGLELLRRTQQAHPGDFWANLDLAEVLHYRARRYEESIRYYVAAVAVRPRSPGPYLDLGNAFRDKGDLDPALTAYREAIRYADTYGAAHVNLGKALYEKGLGDQALIALNRAVALAPPGDRLCQEELGNVLLRVGLTDQAIVCYRTAIELSPNDFRAHNNLGVALSHQQKWDEAIACYRTALRIEPNFALAYFNIAKALRPRQPEEAVGYFRKAFTLDPDFAEDLEYWGDFLRAQGKPHEAADCFQKAMAIHRRRLSLDSQSGRTNNALAWLLVSCADPRFHNAAEAVQLARKAIELGPTNGGFWNTLGVALYRAGDHRAAVAALTKATELRGETACDAFFQAMAHWQLGKKEQARSWRDRAVGCMGKEKILHVEQLLRIQAEALALIQVE